MRLSRRAVTAAAFAPALAPFMARAQGRYPDRPIRVTVPFGPGGLADVTIRLVGERLSQRLGQQVVVVNQPGGAGAIAARAATSSPADGYTLALLTNGTAVSAATARSLGFDPLGDFTPISTLGFFEFVLATSSAQPYRSFRDLQQAAQASPGKLNIGTIQPGSTQHLAAVLLRSLARIDAVIVPFRTTPDALTALLRRDVDLVIDGFSAMGGMLREGQLRALATTGARRSAALPDVPTMIESGFADYDVTSWNALFAPAAVPADIVTRLNAELQAVLADPALGARLAELGIAARGSTPAELGQRLRDDIARWSRVAEQAGLEKL
ncbi:tripartite tricarboxylate transporter substrate-binding protein [Phreatobacter oligotrophus]|uniref:Tripartite-type tricarboxylate transporter receptor subunit TctC n=1 Tax=Phreatobacter oligotrophus TaxID=1122261 RepID=A0A2T4ZHB5_9HYPH|nr:tripartite tricarboxylate transporter substrate-binding protein [Phreatobacter oligotrophus]PTM61378.1 tripartite-type tricarboxylate transporter receptor subunit TctC [Phreatobacter oligotrophus]